MASFSHAVNVREPGSRNSNEARRVGRVLEERARPNKTKSICGRTRRNIDSRTPIVSRWRITSNLLLGAPCRHATAKDIAISPPSPLSGVAPESRRFLWSFLCPIGSGAWNILAIAAPFVGRKRSWRRTTGSRFRAGGRTPSATLSRFAMAAVGAITARMMRTQPHGFAGNSATRWQ